MPKKTTTPETLRCELDELVKAHPETQHVVDELHASVEYLDTATPLLFQAGLSCSAANFYTNDVTPTVRARAIGLVKAVVTLGLETQRRHLKR